MTAHGPESCATCNQKDCHLNFAAVPVNPGQTSFVLDQPWPEFSAYVAAQAGEGDQVIAPGFPGLGRYDWPRVRPVAPLATLRRHVDMHRVAKAPGSVRQDAYLRNDAALALKLGRRIDYLSRHVVVHQTFLPFLWRDGALGGRTFDVLMTRYPLADLQSRLDAVHARHPSSRTIADFRAPAEVVAAEAEALAAARRLIAPHHDIAFGFGARGHWLDWQRPAARERKPGNRIAFLGPTIARQGAYEVRDIAAGLQEPLIVFGADLEGADFWQGVAIERRGFGPGWLDGIAAIVHPAAVTHQPHRLLQAVAAGVRLYADAGCGLAPGEFEPLAAFADSGKLMQ